VIDTVEELLPPHPNAPSAAAKASIVESFHRFIPALQKFRDIRPRSAFESSWRIPGPFDT
jgi:hypothetical protein